MQWESVFSTWSPGIYDDRSGLAIPGREGKHMNTFAWASKICGTVMAAAQQPCTAAFQLWRQPCGCNVLASAALWLQWISSFTRRETKRALGELENSGLRHKRSQRRSAVSEEIRGDQRRSEPEPQRRESQGFYGLPLPGPGLASRTGVMSGKVVDAEKQINPN